MICPLLAGCTDLSVSNQDMDIELVKTPVTRDAVAAIDKENAVYN